MIADILLDVLLEKLSPDEAERTFAKYGVPGALALDKEVLKKEWRKLAVTHHPDKTKGDSAAMKAINAAYDVLKVAAPSNRSQSSYTDWEPSARSRPRPQGRKMWSDEDAESGPFRSGPWEDYPDVPLWAWAGYSGGMPPTSTIRQESYRDLNFIKKTVWQKAGGRHPSEHLECTFWNYDGRYLRGVFTVFGGSQREVMWEAAKAMREWDGSKEAVLMTVKSQPSIVYVVWCRQGGGDVDPASLHYNSFNRNPGNDPEFMARLPSLLQELFVDRTNRRRNA